MGRTNTFTTSRHLLDQTVAYSLWRKGVTDKDIADACKVCVKTVQTWRQRNGLSANKTGQERKAQASTLAQVVAEARAHGMTYGQYMVMKGR